MPPQQVSLLTQAIEEARQKYGKLPEQQPSANPLSVDDAARLDAGLGDSKGVVHDRQCPLIYTRSGKPKPDHPGWGPIKQKSPQLPPPDYALGKGSSPLQFDRKDVGGCNSMATDYEAVRGTPSPTSSQASSLVDNEAGEQSMGNSVSERRERPQLRGSASSATRGALEATDSAGRVTDRKIGEMEEWLRASENPM